MDLNSCTFKHSSLSRPLNDSQSPLSVGFPGLVNARLKWFTCAQSSITKEVNSVPWSTVIEVGNLRLCAARSKAKITSWLVSLKPVSSSTLSRLQLSTTVSTRKAKPLLSWSWTKSMLQRSFGPLAGGGIPRCNDMCFLRRRRILTCRPSRQYKRWTRLRLICQPSRFSMTWIRSQPNRGLSLAISRIRIRKPSCCSIFLGLYQQERDNLAKWQALSIANP